MFTRRLHLPSIQPFSTRPTTHHHTPQHTTHTTLHTTHRTHAPYFASKAPSEWLVTFVSSSFLRAPVFPWLCEAAGVQWRALWVAPFRALSAHAYASPSSHTIPYALKCWVKVGDFEQFVFALRVRVCSLCEAARVQWRAGAGARCARVCGLCPVTYTHTFTTPNSSTHRQSLSTPQSHCSEGAREPVLCGTVPNRCWLSSCGGRHAPRL